MESIIFHEIFCIFEFQSESDIQSEVCSQTEADRQPAAAMDDTHHTHHGNFPQYLVNTRDKDRINAC